LLSYDPNLTGTQVRDTLFGTARHDLLNANGTAATFTSNFNNEFGHGLVDAAAALDELANTGHHDTTAPTATSAVTVIGSGDTAQRQVVFTFNERTVWEHDDVVLDHPSAFTGTYELKGSGTKELILLLSAGAADGSYTVTLKHGANGIRDQAGNAITSDLTASFTINPASGAPPQPGAVVIKNTADHLNNTGNDLNPTTYSDTITRNDAPVFTVVKMPGGVAPDSFELTIARADGSGTPQVRSVSVSGTAAGTVDITALNLDNGVYTAQAVANRFGGEQRRPATHVRDPRRPPGHAVPAVRHALIQRARGIRRAGHATSRRVAQPGPSCYPAHPCARGGQRDPHFHRRNQHAQRRGAV
jgi:hypothetical protein